MSRGVDTMNETEHRQPGSRGGSLGEILLDFWRRFRRNRMAVAGLGMFLIITFVALFANTLAPAPYRHTSVHTFAPPTTDFPMGTDNLGRNTLSGVILGARTSLLVGLGASSVAVTLGVILGALAGFYGGRVEDVIMRAADFILIMPPFFMVLVIAAIIGASIVNVIVIIGIFSSPRIARVVRSQFLKLREAEFTLAARAVGVTNLGIMFKHILPNAISVVIVMGSLQFGQAILSEAGLSFLGLGDPRVVSWGRMLNNAQQYLGRTMWMAFFPGLAIFLTVLSINLVGDGFQDALNPKMRR